MSMEQYSSLEQAYAAVCKERDQLKKQVPGHSYWEDHPHIYGSVRCAHCKSDRTVHWPLVLELEFCPVCGFRMDEEE